jgi:hypothetical protein
LYEYKDFSNPLVRSSMIFYPTDGDGPVEEIWDGAKLTQGECPDHLTPMVVSPRDSDVHYFVNELCELEQGDLFIPKMFVRRQDGLWARGCKSTARIEVCILCVFLQGRSQVDYR